MGPFDQYLTPNSAFPSLPIPKAIFNFQRPVGTARKHDKAVQKPVKQHVPDLSVCGDLLKAKDSGTKGRCKFINTATMG